MILVIEMPAVTIQHIFLPIRADTVSEKSEANLSRCISSFMPKLHYAALNTARKLGNKIVLPNHLGYPEALRELKHP